MTGARLFILRDVVEELFDRGRSRVTLERETARQSSILPLVELLDELRLKTKLHRLGRALLAVGVLTREKLVGHDRRRVDVVPRIRIDAIEHLDRRVGRGECPELAGVEDRSLPVGIGLGAGRTCDAEVEKLDAAVGTLGVVDQECVAGLQVGVDEPESMRICEALAEIPDEDHRLVLGEPLDGKLAHEIVEVSTLHYLHRHVDGVAVAVEVVDGQYWDGRAAAASRFHVVAR